MTDGGGADEELEVFTGVRAPGDGGPVVPVRLKADDRFCFSCHPGVACWNVCCHGADVTLTPHDIVRLCAKLDLRPTAFLERHTVPTLWDTAGLPVAKLKMGGDDGSGPCPFLADEGCTVYAERPATCRYYPLGLARIKPKGAEREDEFHFLVKEPFCRGHDEDKVQPVEAFRREQQVADNERVDRGWMEILMKMASWKTVGGPHGKDLTPQTKQMFFMVSTDVDGLRSFVFGTKFLDTYEVAPETVELIRNDDQALLRLGFDWMKNVIFNEPTITLKDAVLRDAVAKAREEMGGM